MSINVSCAICEKSLLDDSFQKIIDDPRHFGQPLYYANKQFFPDLIDNLYFCSPEHSLEWYQKRIDKNKELT